MKITTIKVTASRTFNHPTERYANFRFAIGAEAQLDYGEDFTDAADSLRAQVENVAEIHKQEILREIAVQQEREELSAQIRLGEGMPELLPGQRRRLEEEEASGWSKKQLQRDIKFGEDLVAELPALRARLASLPLPALLPLPEIHPGHPDHPDTDEGDDRNLAH